MTRDEHVVEMVQYIGIPTSNPTFLALSEESEQHSNVSLPTLDRIPLRATRGLIWIIKFDLMRRGKQERAGSEGHHNSQIAGIWSLQESRSSSAQQVELER